MDSHGAVKRLLARTRDQYEQIVRERRLCVSDCGSCQPRLSSVGETTGYEARGSVTHWREIYGVHEESIRVDHFRRWVRYDHQS